MSDEPELFSNLLKKAMFLADISTCRQLENYLKEHGIDNVSFRRISDYLQNRRVPPAETAMNILKCLDEDYDLESMWKIVEFSKNEIKKPEYTYSLRDPSAKETVRVTIDYADLIPNQLPEQAKMTLENRIFELCGKKNNFSMYINNLIKNDLFKLILTKEDFESE